MKVDFLEDPTMLRYHYYEDVVHDPRGRRYDFRAHPELISEVLEDYIPFSHEPGVRRFYDLLRFVNGDTDLETDDCAFRGPKPEKDSATGRTWFCSGRVIFHFREIERNLDRRSVETLTGTFFAAIRDTEPEFPDGASRVELARTSYNSSGGDEPIGGAVCVTFWAFGDNERQTFENLDRVMEILDAATRRVCDQVRAALRAPRETRAARRRRLRSR